MYISRYERGQKRYFASKGFPRMGEQYIVCYDIENSVIYDVAEDIDGQAISDEDYETLAMDLLDRELLPQLKHIGRGKGTQRIKEYICKQLGQTETRYIDRDNVKAAQEIIDNFNEAHNKKLMLIPLTHKYLSNFYIYNAKTKKINSIFCYTPEDDNRIFRKLYRMFKAGADILFTAHNLDYEYSYIRYNTNLLQLITEPEDNKRVSVIANGTHDIKSIEVMTGILDPKNGQYYIAPCKLLIRDSLLMTNKSIKNLGEAYKLPKLPYNYDQTRTDPEQLTDLDRAYNQRDNEIALRAILEIQEQQEIYKDITQLPISATQHSRNTCKFNYDVNIPLPQRKEKYNTLEKKHNQLAYMFNMPSEDLFQKFFNASGGGLIGVNPLECDKWHSDVHSFDIKSAHPSQAFNKLFPQGDKIEAIPTERYSAVIRELKGISEIMMKNPKFLYNDYTGYHDYLLLIKFTGLREKNINGNVINSLGAGKAALGTARNEKLQRQAYNFNGVNQYGKCRRSEQYIKWVYGIDLIYHLTFYEYDNIEILEGYEYPLVNCDEYVLRKFEYYGANKELYKSFTKQAKKLQYEELLKIILESSAEEYTKRAVTAENYVDFLDGELLRIKGIFNGIFGQEYQAPVHDDMQIQRNDWYSITAVSQQNYDDCITKTKIHYCTGAYIAAWTRFELACMIWHAINNGGKLFYWATDSIKGNNIPDTLFNDWCYGHTTQAYKRNVFNFGAVDCETSGNPLEFYTTETLKHIDVCRGKDREKLHIGFTISGFKAGVYLKDFLEKWEGADYTEENVNEVKKQLTELFKPHIIPADQTGKLVRDRSYSGYTTPLNQRNFGALLPMEYNLGRFGI